MPSAGTAADAGVNSKEQHFPMPVPEVDAYPVTSDTAWGDRNSWPEAHFHSLLARLHICQPLRRAPMVANQRECQTQVEMAGLRQSRNVRLGSSNQAGRAVPVSSALVAASSSTTATAGFSILTTCVHTTLSAARRRPRSTSVPPPSGRAGPDLPARVHSPPRQPPGRHQAQWRLRLPELLPASPTRAPATRERVALARMVPRRRSRHRRDRQHQRRALDAVST